MGKQYDDYDYEEAYKEQCEKLEEEELERLVREKKVRCLYRATTIKSTNEKSGTTILESQVYPSFASKEDMPVTEKKRESRPSQKNLNPPDLGMNVINALMATDEIIIPVSLDAYSLDGLEEQMEQIRQLKRLNHKMSVGQERGIAYPGKE